MLSLPSYLAQVLTLHASKDFKPKPQILQLIWSLSEIYQSLYSQPCRLPVNESVLEVCKNLVCYMDTPVSKGSVWQKARSNNYMMWAKSHFDRNKILVEGTLWGTEKVRGAMGNSRTLCKRKVTALFILGEGLSASLPKILSLSISCSADSWHALTLVG